MNTNHHLPESTSGAACDAVAPLLPLVAQRLLEPEEAQAVQEHVAGCDHCRARLAAYDGLDHALRRRFEQIASSPIRMEELMRRVQHEEQYVRREEQSDLIEESPLAPLSIPSAPLRPVRRSPRRVFSWLAAIAAVLVIALITTALVASHHPSPTTGRPRPTTNGTPPITVYGSAFSNGDSPDSTLFALNGATGKALWTNKSDTSRVKPFVENGIFYIAASNGGLSAYRASDGKLLWSQQSLGIILVQQVVDGVIYAPSFNNARGQYSLYALDGRTGQVLWHFTKGTDPQAVVDGVVYVASATPAPGQQGTIYALNARDGSERWKFQALGIVAVAQVVDGQVYIGEDNSTSAAQVTLYVLDARTGQQRWSYPKSPVSQMSVLGVNDGLLAVLSNEGATSVDIPARQLYGLNTSDGTVRWHVELELGRVYALYDNGVIYIGMDNAIAAYRASDGQLLWKNTNTKNNFPEFVANGVLYLDNSNTTMDAVGLIAVDAASGQLLWKVALGNTVHVAAAAKGLAFVTTLPPVAQGDNRIYALDVATGKVRWSYDLGHDFAHYLVVTS